MGKADVGNVVNKIEDIDSEIEKLTQEKERLTKENTVELLKHDLKTMEEVYKTLKNLKTEKVIGYIEEEVVLESIGLIIDNTVTDLSEMENEEEFIKKQLEENS